MNSVSIIPYRVEPGWLIGAASHFVDRVVADCEHILLPEKETVPGKVTFWRGEAVPPSPSKKRLFQLSRQDDKIEQPHGNVIDLRCNEPGNWAHFLNNHLPLTFLICDAMDIDVHDVLLVLPSYTPSYILKLVEQLRIQVLITDAAISGQSILFEASPWICLRGLRHEWAAGTSARKAMASALDLASGKTFPSRIFVSRKGTRKLENEDQVRDWLARMGFTLLYAEDFNPSEQMALFRSAEIVVAVHGAALAPLLYAPAHGRKRHLVEILPCGHMTDVYRVMSQQMGWNWIGVRGIMKPKYVVPAYDLDKMYTMHSLDNFKVDLRALEAAFKIAEIGG